MTKLLLFASCLFAVIADMLMVLWAKNQKHQSWLLIIGVFLIMITGVIWSYSIYKGMKVTAAITIYAILSIIGCSFTGIIVFHEQLTIINIIGMIVGIIALIMISI